MIPSVIALRRFCRRPKSRPPSVAVLCHGFLSGKNSTTNKTLTRALTDRGIATFRFDFFGQGESEGPFEELTNTLAVGQAGAALDLMKEKGFRRIGLMGPASAAWWRSLPPQCGQISPAWP